MDHVRKHRVKQNIVRRQLTIFDEIKRQKSKLPQYADDYNDSERPEFGKARDLMSLMMIKENF